MRTESFCPVPAHYVHGERIHHSPAPRVQSAAELAALETALAAGPRDHAAAVRALTADIPPPRRHRAGIER